MNWTVDRRCYPLGPLMMGQGILAKAAKEGWCSSATVLVEAKTSGATCQKSSVASSYVESFCVAWGKKRRNKV